MRVCVANLLLRNRLASNRFEVSLLREGANWAVLVRPDRTRRVSEQLAAVESFLRSPIPISRGG